MEIRFGDLFLTDPKLPNRLVQAPASSPLALTVPTATSSVGVICQFEY